MEEMIKIMKNFSQANRFPYMTQTGYLANTSQTCHCQLNWLVTFHSNKILFQEYISEEFVVKAFNCKTS